MYVYVHDKELRWDILRPKKVTDKDDAPNQSMSLPQCCALGYLNFEADSQHQMVPTLPCSPNISKCQVSDCHEKSIDENKDMRKII